MVKEPRFLSFNNKLYLMAVSFQDGEIVELEGPYQCTSEPHKSSQEFVQVFTSMMVKALHVAKPIELKDLPQHLQDKLTNS